MQYKKISYKLCGNIKCGSGRDMEWVSIDMGFPPADEVERKERWTSGPVRHRWDLLAPKYTRTCPRTDQWRVCSCGRGSYILAGPQFWMFSSLSSSSSIIHVKWKPPKFFSICRHWTTWSWVGGLNVFVPGVFEHLFSEVLLKSYYSCFLEILLNPKTYDDAAFSNYTPKLWTSLP